jgi:hypothetical protein
MAASNNYCEYTSLDDYSKTNSGSGNARLSYMGQNSQSYHLKDITQPFAYPISYQIQNDRISSFQRNDVRQPEFGGPGYAVAGHQSHNYNPYQDNGMDRAYHDPSRISMLGMDGIDDGETTSETRARELNEQESGIKSRDEIIAQLREADRKAQIAADKEADKRRLAVEKSNQVELARQARLADQARQFRESEIADQARLDEMSRRDEQDRLEEQARLAEIRRQKKQIADRQLAIERKETMRLNENERRRLADRCSGYDQLDNAYNTNMW